MLKSEFDFEPTTNFYSIKSLMFIVKHIEYYVYMYGLISYNFGRHSPIMH
jgi:hypothetical protein